MNIVRGAYSFLARYKDKINKFLPFFLASYMVLLILPYVFGRVEVMNNFFSSGYSQMIYRFISMLYAVGYLALIGIVNRIKIKWHYLVGGGILLLIFLLSSIISPKDIYFPDGTFFIHLPTSWYIYDYIKFTLAVVMFIEVISFIPRVMKSPKDLYLSIYILIGVTLLSVLLSFILEYDLIVELLNGTDGHEVAIHSIYQSKNTYGLFLFLASLGASFLVFTNEDNKYLLFIIPLLVFTVMAIITSCRTATIACFMLTVYLFVRLLIMLYPISKKTFYIIIGIVGAVALVFTLYMSIPSWHAREMKGLYNAINYGIKGIQEALEGRAVIWNSVGEFMKGHYLVIGANLTSSQYLLGAYNGYYRDFHSGYVKWFAVTGIIGTIIYSLLFIYIFYLIYKAIRKNLLQGLLVLIYLLTTMLYSIPEANVIFISTSIYTWVTNMFIVVYLEYLLKDDVEVSLETDKN